MLNGCEVVRPAGGGKGMPTGLRFWLIGFVAQVMIKTMKPLMREAAGTGILGKSELAGCRNVMRGYTGLATDSVLQAQLTAQRNDRLRHAQRLHQIQQRSIKLLSGPIAFGTGNPTANLNAAEPEATAYFHKRRR